MSTFEYIKLRWGSPLNDCIWGEKPKTTIFENEQFSGHFVFDKNNCFFGEKTFFPPINKNSYFIFLKKNVFLEIVFRKQFFQNFKNISAHKKFVKLFFNFFEKHFPKKTFFFKKINSCLLRSPPPRYQTNGKSF